MSELEAICERVEGYTPGPMKSRAYIGGAYAVYQVAPNGDRIVHCAEVFGSLGRLRATAELFAAAPDLLRIATEQAQRIEELQAEVSQYEWLIKQAKTRVEELEAAVERSITTIESLLARRTTRNVDEVLAEARAALDVTNRTQVDTSVDEAIKQEDSDAF